MPMTEILPNKCGCKHEAIQVNEIHSLVVNKNYFKRSKVVKEFISVYQWFFRFKHSKIHKKRCRWRKMILTDNTMTDRSEKYFKSQKYIKLYKESVYDGVGFND